MGKKAVILCFDKSEEREVQAFMRRIQNREEEKGNEDIEVHIIYPVDVNEGQYMTWESAEPEEADKEILESMTPDDHLYIWGHGAPSNPYIPGAFYTEIGDYLDKTLNKEVFGPDKGTLKINVEICNGGRGGVQGENSFAARLHSYLGKLGIYSEVAGRLRNVSVDIPNLPHEGLKSIPRHYDGLSNLIALPDSYYEHQAERSKVTYAWGGIDGKVQLRVDGYRRSLTRDYLELKDALMKEVSDSRMLDPRKIHKLLLGIEFRISNPQIEMKPAEIHKAAHELYEYCKMAGLKEETLEKLGFERFIASISRKASSNGFLEAPTGVRSDDKKLPVEVKALRDILFENPEMKKLNNLVERLKEKADTNPNIARLVEKLGCEESFAESNLYASFFMMYRKSIIHLDTGTVEFPVAIKNIIDPLNHLLEKVYLNEQASPAEKQKSYALYMQSLGDYTTGSTWGNFKAKVRGALFGFKLAHNERHEASLLEYIPNLFRSAYTLSNTEVEFFEGFKQDLAEMNELIKSDITPQNQKQNASKYSMKSMLNIAKIPPNEREENIYAVFSILDDPLMDNQDGATPLIIEDIKSIVGNLDHNDEKAIAQALVDIRKRLDNYDESSLNEDAKSVLQAFENSNLTSFEELRNALSDVEHFKDIMDDASLQTRVQNN
ncbi:hypothetical protein [Legionella genomosp. 1]|uniref:hypothetical protein n=1 Tax=Legionella genomosp. 1 TaxID=1093625 RepID=UPI001056CD2C|nr:hypothetical protein [Legionella genomosp. 1]